MGYRIDVNGGCLPMTIIITYIIALFIVPILVATGFNQIDNVLGALMYLFTLGLMLGLAALAYNQIPWFSDNYDVERGASGMPDIDFDFDID